MFLKINLLCFGQDSENVKLVCLLDSTDTFTDRYFYLVKYSNGIKTEVDSVGEFVNNKSSVLLRLAPSTNGNRIGKVIADTTEFLNLLTIVNKEDSVLFEKSFVKQVGDIFISDYASYCIVDGGLKFYKDNKLFQSNVRVGLEHNGKYSNSGKYFIYVASDGVAGDAFIYLFNDFGKVLSKESILQDFDKFNFQCFEINIDETKRRIEMISMQSNGPYKVYGPVTKKTIKYSFIQNKLEQIK